MLHFLPTHVGVQIFKRLHPSDLKHAATLCRAASVFAYHARDHVFAAEYRKLAKKALTTLHEKYKDQITNPIIYFDNMAIVCLKLPSTKRYQIWYQPDGVIVELYRGQRARDRRLEFFKVTYDPHTITPLG